MVAQFLIQFFLTRNGRFIPLQSLDEKELGLCYEANNPIVDETQHTPALENYLSGYPDDPVRNEQWMRKYLVDNPYCIWESDYNIWLLAQDKWVIGGHPKRDPIFKWDVRLEELLIFLDRLPEQKRVVCNIHPSYVG